MKKFLIVLVCLLASAGFLFAQAAEEAVDEVMMDTGRTGGEFVINNGAEPESLDPHLIEGVPEHRIYLSLFEGLTTYDPETALAVPGMAKSWEITNDGMTYTFTIRTDIPWVKHNPVTLETTQEVDADGNPRFVTANDFVYGIWRPFLCAGKR